MDDKVSMAILSCLLSYLILMLFVYPRAMNGNVKFEDALAARLEIIRPSKNDIKTCLKQNPPNLTKGMIFLIFFISYIS